MFIFMVICINDIEIGCFEFLCKKWNEYYIFKMNGVFKDKGYF